jgi:hypothetical protein
MVPGTHQKVPRKTQEEQERLLEHVDPEILKQVIEEEEAHDWSGTVVPNTDDPTVPTFTFRVFLLGTLWSIFLAISNTLFSFRKNPFGISSVLVVLLAYPMGLFLELVLVNKKVFGISLNPGKFSVKEHVLIVMMAASAGHRPYGVDNVVGQAAEQFLVRFIFI